MKILIPTTGFLKAGGMRVLSELASNFIELGHQAEFLAPAGGSDPYFPTRAKVIRYPVLFQKIPLLRYVGKVISMSLWIRRRRAEYDVVLANASATAYPVAIGTGGHGNGYYYIQAYEPDFAKERKWPLSTVESVISTATYRLNLKRIVNSALYLNYREIKACHVVEPGIDLGVFNPNGRAAPNREQLTIGCIGRKEKWKGTHLVIEAVRAVREERNLNIKLRIAFNLPSDYDGQDDEFIELVQPHGDRNLADFYRQADLFCAAGMIQDGAFHYPCMEAMACGTPVITNYGPGNSENSYYLTKVTSEEIKRSILRYLDSEIAVRDAMVARGVSTVRDYSWPMIAGKMTKIFEEDGDRS